MESLVVDRLSSPKLWISSGPMGQFLELGKKHFANYLIFNALGKVEIEGELTGKSRIDIRALSRGIYFIQFLQDKQTRITRQFIKL